MLKVINPSKTSIAYGNGSTLGVSFNPSKCHIMHVTRKKNPTFSDYTIKGQTPSTADTATYLWVELLSDLTCNKQAETVAAKANRTLCFIRRTVTTSSPDAKAVANKTLVRLHMEYGPCVTDPHTQLLINKRERVQCHGAAH